MKIINVGIIAHADAGKTTLTEQLMYACKAVRSFGSVDKGTAQTDALKVEQERGISVKVSSAVLQLGETKINIIDTPGHSDFLGEVERSLSVLDYAVLVVSAVEGIQAQTEVLLSVVKKMGIPLFVFINKIDRAGSISDKVFAELSVFLKSMGREPVQINRVINESEHTVSLAPNPQLTEALVFASGSEALLEEFLEHGTVALGDAPVKALSACKWAPVLFGSSKASLGVEELGGALCTYSEEYVGHSNEFCGRVFKVDFDPLMGKGAHVRLFSGELKSRQSVHNQRTGKEEKCTALRLASGRKLVDIPSASSGDIAVAYGFESVRAGDLLGRGAERYAPVSIAAPMLSVRVTPQKVEELSALVKAMTQLSDEDPLLDFEWITQKRELRIKISGKIQVEILELLLLERYALAVQFSSPSVIYKETPKMIGEGFDAYTMPKPCWAVLRFKIEPLPLGTGLVYESLVKGNGLLYRYRNHVETAVPRALKQGLHGWEVTDLKVTLIYGEHHLVHTHPLDFFLCTPLAIMNGLQNTGTNLLEPYYRIRLSAPEEFLGKTIGVIQGRRGTFDAPIFDAGRFTLVALAPVADCMELPEAFAILTGGRGSYSAGFSHYEPCPPNVIVERERIGVNPLDRPKFILEQRSALSVD